MVKCPNCGSTAQVKLACKPFISTWTEMLTEGFSCGCGCHFRQEYTRNDQGQWEFYSQMIDYMEKE